MIIAKEKKESNIAEYILYMWQIEDLIRAYNFDIDIINKNIISQFNQPENIIIEIKNWYKGLIQMMIEEGIKEKGHLQFITNIVNDLNKFHSALLISGKHNKYQQLYSQAADNINSFKQKTQDKKNNDIEICLKGLYAILILRLKKKNISEGTNSAVKTFSNLLAYLSQQYKKFEKGDLELVY
ncbi:MAG: DUF4924 domain-containing protein [Bacteroidetes bacterium]|nr:MAG: DUF4924 domain-containing protein [Bacteroidota bacterium]